ncbi:MAG: hypothetical protein AB1Z21_08030 [Synechococcaceae cyanobacterium]
MELGPFPQTTDDGRSVLFSLRSDEDLSGRVDERSLRGSVVAHSGARRETAVLTLSPTSAPQMLGPFEVQPAAGTTALEMAVVVREPLPASINVPQIRAGRAATPPRTSASITGLSWSSAR